MYSVESDQSNRLLVISAAGKVTQNEVEAVALRVREMMEHVTPGFRVLTDFRWLDRMEPAAARHLAEIMDALAEKDVAAVVWVVPDPHKDIGLNISLAIPLRTEHQARDFRVVSRRVAGVDGRRNMEDVCVRRLLLGRARLRRTEGAMLSVKSRGSAERRPTKDLPHRNDPETGTENSRK